MTNPAESCEIFLVILKEKGRRYPTIQRTEVRNPDPRPPRFLKEKNKGLKTFAVEPVESAVLSGGAPGPHKIQGIGAGFIPNNCDQKVIDETIQISGPDAMAMARRLAKEEVNALNSQSRTLDHLSYDPEHPEFHDGHFVQLCLGEMRNLGNQNIIISLTCVGLAPFSPPNLYYLKPGPELHTFDLPRPHTTLMGPHFPKP